ncbi:hypothetical protein [Bifidobacterium sp. A11]|uniref:hypothetical protein n=1 Tax=Bifidobacterium sp. A11 TaxID=1394176 RepID=UPI000464983A|nr:hypothetical protein [Bifidobacterium sp. A11]
MYKRINAEVNIDDNAASILPKDDYTYLLGACLYVFDGLTGFIVEIILYDKTSKETWYDLTDKSPIQLLSRIEKSIDGILGTHIKDDFNGLRKRRNRIVHAFTVTYNHEQALETKTTQGDAHPNEQTPITRECMERFIADVMALQTQLNGVRDQLGSKDLD